VLTRRASFIGLSALCVFLIGSRDVDAAESPRFEAFPHDLAVLKAAPERVVIRFASGIKSRSTLYSVIGPTDSSSLSIDGSGGPPVLELSIPVVDQGRGRYVVRWEIQSTTGESFGGRVRFVVRN
jgi:methionine-rich copper-binding protein CopC